MAFKIEKSTQINKKRIFSMKENWYSFQNAEYDWKEPLPTQHFLLIWCTCMCKTSHACNLVFYMILQLPCKISRSHNPIFFQCQIQLKRAIADIILSLIRCTYVCKTSHVFNLVFYINLQFLVKYHGHTIQYFYSSIIKINTHIYNFYTFPIEFVKSTK